MIGEKDEVTVQEIEEPQEEEQASIRLINVIFLPFNPVVQLVTTCAVITKCLLGPLKATYPTLLCAPESEIFIVLYYAFGFYEYFSDIIVAIDFFLHIIHRQVTEEASKRGHPPKSLMALCLDALSLIPFLSFSVKEVCPPTKLWPNIMAVAETLCFYRIIEYFDLKDTHSLTNIIIGYTIIVIFMTILVSCVFVLLTYHGMCSACAENIYDWRVYFKYRFTDMDEGYNLYSFALSITANSLFFINAIDFKPATYIGFALTCIIMTIGFLFLKFQLGPKLFAEVMIGARKRSLFHTRANRIIEEANKRNPSTDNNFDLENYFSVIWKKMEGVMVPPDILHDIPRYMKVHMKEDIAWAVFHHSPTLRRTSSSYKRWLYDQMVPEHRMAGERLFSGRHCYTHLYYLKAGVVQLLAADDGASPVLSVAGGSLLGDVSFHLPPLRRRALVRCLTYCEIIAIPRDKLLSSMHKFPEDRSMIMKSVSERIRHAKILTSCKTDKRGLDRTEDEGLAWLKTRWWDLWTAIQHWKKSSKKEIQKCILPAEKSPYHCSKYIGQLVLCTKDQLQLSKIFDKITFPWILSENSSFTIIWHKTIKFVVFIVLLLFPPNVAKERKPDWFDFLNVVVNVIYTVDLILIVITKTEEQRNIVDSKEVMIAKVKSWRFLLDVLSTAWLGRLLGALGHDAAAAGALADVAPLARLLKLHVFFDTKFDTWKRNKNPLNSSITNYLLFSFFTLYISAYLLFILLPLMGRELITSVEFLFGPLVCTKIEDNKCKSSESSWVFYYYILHNQMGFAEPKTSYEAWIYISNCVLFYLLAFYGQYKIMSVLFLKYRDIFKYNIMVTSLRTFYIQYDLHPAALKRVKNYFLCQWKSDYGVSVMYPSAIEGASQSAYWAHHGRAAERLVGGSRLLEGAHSSFIRDLAEKCRFTLIPQGFSLILFGVQCTSITWIVNGELKCEYVNNDGDIVSHYSKPTDALTLAPLFPSLPAFKTYVTATDCEILYITKKDFFKVLKQHPKECSRINACIEELAPIFDDIFRHFLKQHQTYQKKLRERIFYNRKSVFAVTVTQKFDLQDTPLTSVPFGTTFSSPEAPFVRFWITTRMLVVFLSIVNINLRYFFIHVSSTYENVSYMILSFCDLAGFADIVLKMFLPYFDDRGLIISEYKKCTKYYLSRGFILDLIGSVPWKYFVFFMNDDLAAYSAATEYEIYTKYAHLYIINGFFNYIVDKPCIYQNYVLFIKWQLITFLVMLGAGNFFFHRCFEWRFNKYLNFESSTVRRGNSCWKSKEKVINHTHSSYPYRIAVCVEMAQDFMFGVFRPGYNAYSYGTTLTWLVGLSLNLVFWFVSIYCQALIILDAQTNASFQHALQELDQFLKEERVEKPTVKRCIAHYNYNWLRMKGVNNEKLYKDIGPGNNLKEDVNFYIFKSAYDGLNTIFKGGEMLARKLSAVVINRSFLPNEDIVREMDLAPFVYIVRRGNVAVSRRGRNLASIPVGGIFGQLSGARPRPACVTARTADHADVLELSIEDFQDIFAQEYKEILTKNRYDFINVKKKTNFIPSIKVEYLIRGVRIIKFPYFMSKPIDIRSCVWYERFLYFVWMWLLSANIYGLGFWLLLYSRPIISKYLYIFNNILDCLFLVYYITELFTMELVIVHNKIECIYLKWKLLLRCSFIFNTMSLVFPKLEYFFVLDLSYLNFVMDLSRILRSYDYIFFYKHFCSNLQDKYSVIILKLIILFNILHFSACLWIHVDCGIVSAKLAHSRQRGLIYAPEYVNKSIDWNDWTFGKLSVGCLRKTQEFETPEGPETGVAVSRHWHGDYAVAFWKVLTMLTHTEIDLLKKFGQVRILRTFLTFIIQWSRFWITAAAVAFFFGNFSELYVLERRIEALKTYFKCNKLSSALLEAMDTYAIQLWKKQKGRSIPQFARDAPRCLQQDIFSALYMHHLRTPTLFQVFPEYFLRQLAVRLTRKVVFPGNYIVQEGDVHPTLYFIHEGEVEKWCTDSKGESKISCVLTMNGYFGLVPALFPNTHYQFAYYSRTVVDLICLNHNDWQDLLDGYSDIKAALYKSAQKFKHGDKHRKSKVDAQTGK